MISQVGGLQAEKVPDSADLALDLFFLRLDLRKISSFKPFRRLFDHHAATEVKTLFIFMNNGYKG